MTVSRYLLRSLFFHRRAHFAVLLGAAVGCAVLTGALLVGDSLRGSLRDRAEVQRQGIDYAMVSPKFFSPGVFADRVDVEKGIIIGGSLQSGSAGDERFLSGVTILAGFFEWGSDSTISIPQALAE